MRVLYYTNKFGFVTETFIYNEVKGLSSNAEVLVLCQERENEERFPYDNWKIVPKYENAALGKGIKFLNSISPVKVKSFRQAWLKHIKEFNPDVIIIPFGTIASRVLLSHDFSLDIPVLIIFHGYDASKELNDPAYTKRLKELMGKENIHAAFVSHEMRDRMAKSGFPFKNNHVLYCGVNTERFRRENYNRPKEPFTFLQVSSLVPKKGHEYSLKAFALMLDKHPELKEKVIWKIGGGGDALTRFKEMAQELDISGNVEFLDWVSVEENIRLMEEAHAFIHHSITPADGNKEGIPTVIMEAMAMELPVITTQHSGIPELVEDGVNGYLVEERDIEATAEKMHAILDWDYQAKNREKVQTLFDEKVHDASLWKLLDRIKS